MQVLRELARIMPFLAGAAVITLSAPALAAGWELVFSDEFNGDSLDRNKWGTRYIYENETLDRFKDEKQRYRDNQNHVFSDGALTLVARKGEADLYESGMIRTHRTFYYGYFEARVFLPSARGAWAAFWLVGDYDLDGKTWHPPEADIFEFALNGVEDKDDMLHSEVVEGDKVNYDSYTYTDPSYRLKWRNMHAEAPLNRGWHTAGYVWAPDRVSFFWDGRHIYTRKYQWLNNEGKLGAPAQLILNLAVGGGWAGRHGIEQAAFPQSFKIDFVRVCQYTSGDGGSRQCGDSTVTPDPQVFGYSAPFNDMAKPTFLPLETPVGGSLPSGGAVSLAQNPEPQEIIIPFSLPEGYPRDRTLTVSIIDESNQAVIFSQSAKLGDSGTIKHTENVSFFKATPPPLPNPGQYRLSAHMAVEFTEDDKKEVRWVPLACSTGIPQPPKSRSCKLLSIRSNSG